VSIKKTILAGYSGHGFVVAEAAFLSNIKIDGYLEPDEVSPNHFNLEHLGFEMDPNFKWNTDNSFILGIGDNKIRHKLGKLILLKGRVLLNIIHPTTSITQMMEIGKGNFIARNASINPLVSLGDFCIVNTGAIIEHECKIGDAVHIGPGAVLAGSVSVGAGSFIGANAVIKQGVKIGCNVVIGAGSVIIRDVSDNLTIVGNPGRVI
jgi:sugar O-acyltransferase (sialic acid O-acetyltransferase NeuD family)